MNRRTKIELLRAYSEGNIPADYLQPPKTFVFMEILGKKGYYIKEGVEYTEAEYLDFCNRIEDKKKLYYSLSPEIEVDQIITVVFRKGVTIT